MCAYEIKINIQKQQQQKNIIKLNRFDLGPLHIIVSHTLNENCQTYTLYAQLCV